MQSISRSVNVNISLFLKSIDFSQIRLKIPILSDIINYLIEQLRIPKDKIHCICDPSLKYHIDKPIEYKIKMTLEKSFCCHLDREPFNTTFQPISDQSLIIGLKLNLRVVIHK